MGGPEDLGHWAWNGPPFEIEDYYGFVYCIRDPHHSMSYIGKKAFLVKRRYTPKGRVNARITYRDSGWRSYTGSSDLLNSAISDYGKESFVFEILSLWKYKSSLWYAEIKEIVNRDALTKPTEYYNGQLPSMKFRPKEDEGLYP